MPIGVERRLGERGLELPPPLPAPRSRLRRSARSVELVYPSRNGSFRGNELVCQGKLGRDLTLKQGREAAAPSPLNVVRVLRDHGDDLDAVRAVKAFGMISSDPSFVGQAGAVSRLCGLIVHLFGSERGLHARPAGGMASMRWDVPAGIEAMCEVGA